MFHHVEYDLTAHEPQRLAAVIEASEDWNPAEALAGEVEAHRLLYSDLDADQHAVYEMLIAEGLIDA